MADLSERRCTPCEGGTPPLHPERIQDLLHQVEQWSLDASGTSIVRTYYFKNYYETVAFANAVAWIAHRQNHHPKLEVEYKSCKVSYSTHAIGGLSENDFICAAQVNRLLSA